MNFNLYFNLGIEHITDPLGYDHILFIIVMCANFRLIQWKNLAILVTAFTVGHSLSLALAVLKIVPVYSELIEFLIPLSILISCIYNISYPQGYQITDSKKIKNSNIFSYILILGFGLIHGLGFSNFLRETLVANESLFVPLFAFNLGLEVGQLMIVGVFLLINLLFLEIMRKQPRDWTMVISGAIASVSLLLLLEKGAALFNVS